MRFRQEVPRRRRVEEGAAQLAYRRTDDALTIEGLAVLPTCPFARGWLERHPDS